MTLQDFAHISSILSGISIVVAAIRYVASSIQKTRKQNEIYLLKREIIKNWEQPSDVGYQDVQFGSSIYLALEELVNDGILVHFWIPGHTGYVWNTKNIP